jgi:Asp-tRNA(Asn)/Glu-tRNA(Gln) amidotransferase A subunit family amidase
MPHQRRFLNAIAHSPRKLRIAMMLKDHRGVQLHPECLEAVQRAAKLCASLGTWSKRRTPSSTWWRCGP